MNARLPIARVLAGTGLLEAAESFKELRWRRRADQIGSYSQFGEDLYVLQYFAQKYEGTYLDVGANHPFKLSNTYLLYRCGWRGVTIEPIVHLYDLHRRWRPEDMHVNGGVSIGLGSMTFFELFPKVLSTFDRAVAENLVKRGEAFIRREVPVGVFPLQDICDRYLGKREIDLLSLDTEGFDLDALRSLDWSRTRPKLIVCEMYGLGEAKSDAEAITALLAEQGYREVHTLGCNTFFAPEA